ncbi:MAG: FHA domain-containing protein [Saprospirales bacterium]|nr:MAG: FHA domain-containing protein [Saprospirales bacterium]
MDEKINLTIGRAANCELVLTDKSISRIHAKAEIYYYDKIFLVDQNSANGTFVNNKRIKKAQIKTTDKLKFGEYIPDNKSFFKELFNRYKSNKNDFSREYDHMLEQFAKYQKKLDALQDNPKGPLYLKLGLLAGFIGFMIFFSDRIDQRFFYPMIIGISGLTLLGGIFTGSRGNRNKKIAELKMDYDRVLRCPKCNTPFISKHLVMVERMSECSNDNCNALYKKDREVRTL